MTELEKQSRQQAIDYLQSIGAETDEERVLLAQFLATQPSVRQIHLCTSLVIEARKVAQADSAQVADYEEAARETVEAWTTERRLHDQRYITSQDTRVLIDFVSRLAARVAREKDARIAELEVKLDTTLMELHAMCEGLKFALEEMPDSTAYRVRKETKAALINKVREWSEYYQRQVEYAARIGDAAKRADQEIRGEVATMFAAEMEKVEIT